MEHDCLASVPWSICNPNVSSTYLWRTGDAVIQCPYATLTVLKVCLLTKQKCCTQGVYRWYRWKSSVQHACLSPTSSLLTVVCLLQPVTLTRTRPTTWMIPAEHLFARYRFCPFFTHRKPISTRKRSCDWGFKNSRSPPVMKSGLNLSLALPTDTKLALSFFHFCLQSVNLIVYKVNSKFSYALSHSS